MTSGLIEYSLFLHQSDSPWSQSRPIWRMLIVFVWSSNINPIWGIIIRTEEILSQSGEIQIASREKLLQYGEILVPSEENTYPIWTNTFTIWKNTNPIWRNAKYVKHLWEEHTYIF